MLLLPLFPSCFVRLVVVGTLAFLHLSSLSGRMPRTRSTAGKGSAAGRAEPGDDGSGGETAASTSPAGPSGRSGKAAPAERRARRLRSGRARRPHRVIDLILCVAGFFCRRRLRDLEPRLGADAPRGVLVPVQRADDHWGMLMPVIPAHTGRHTVETGCRRF